MEQFRAQLWNYLDWLESRGLTGTLVFAPATVVTVPASFPVSLAQSKWRLGFYSATQLRDDETVMVTRIAAALGLAPSDFYIWAEESLVRVPQDMFLCPILVALGASSGQTLLASGQTVAMNVVQASARGALLLTISHPRAMLQDPSLKSSAWAALQNLKASYSL